MDVVLLAVSLWAAATIVGVIILSALGKVLGFSREAHAQDTGDPSSSDDPIENVHRSGRQTRRAIDHLAREFLRKVRADTRR